MKAKVFLIALIILLPSSFQLPQPALPVGSFYITAVEMLVFAILFLGVMEVLFQKRQRLGRTLFGRQVLIILCLYTLYVIVGLFQRDATKVLGDFRQYMPLVLYFPLRTMFLDQSRSEGRRRVLLTAVMIVSVYIIIIAVFFMSRLKAYSAANLATFADDRIFIDNSLFLFLAYLGYMVAHFFSSDSVLSRRVFYLAAISLGILALLLMQVRTFWVVTVIILFLSILSFRGFGKKLHYAVSTLFLSLFMAVLIPLAMGVISPNSKTLDSIKERVVSFSELDKVGQRKAKRSESMGSLDTRLATAKLVMNKYIAENWISGLGFGGEIPLANILGSSFMKYQIDNGYLTLLAKFGVFGMLFYLALTAKIIRSLFRIISDPLSERDEVFLAKSFLYAIPAMAIGSVSTSVFIREQACIVSFVIMLCEIEAINYRLSNRKAEKDETVDAVGLRWDLSAHSYPRCS